MPRVPLAFALTLALGSVSCARADEPPGACLHSEACPADEFCARPEGSCEAVGACRVRPELCIEIYRPVCGCDHRTYANDCHAAAAGVAVASQRKCPSGDR